MSHFNVIVVGQDMESQLEPFWELDLSPEEAKNDSRAVFEPEFTIQEAEEELKKSLETWREQKKKKNLSESRLEMLKKYTGRSSQKKLIEYMLEENGYSFNEDEEEFGYYTNPEARWDWWVTGGRWSGYFKLKRGRTGEVGERSWTNDGKKLPKNRVDIALKKDIDWEGMSIDRMKKAEKDWETFSKENKKWCGGNKRKYIKRCKSNAPFAVLWDGEWYESGSMGWFGVTHSEKEPASWDKEFEQILAQIPDTELLTIVDCHT